jgi:hypothetical protein
LGIPATCTSINHFLTRSCVVERILAIDWAVGLRNEREKPRRQGISMTWKRNLVKLVSGLMLLGALALSGGADLFEGSLLTYSGTVSVTPHR